VGECGEEKKEVVEDEKVVGIGVVGM